MTTSTVQATSNPQDRQKMVTQALNQVRQHLDQQGLTREALSLILSELKALAAQTALWNADDFPPPEEGERQARYFIGEQDDNSIVLYLNVMRPGKRIPPHNHTTWACIAAVEGAELNTIYQRLDDGQTPGQATLEVDHELVVGPGSGVALMPDDIHSVLIEGETPIRHLHLYGRALETLTERLTFDLDTGTCRIMDIGVKTRRAGA